MNIDEQIRCVCREIGMRRVVYPGRVRAGKMSQTDADKEIKDMEAVHQTLLAVKARQHGN